jgi:hypothetical protein
MDEISQGSKQKVNPTSKPKAEVARANSHPTLQCIADRSGLSASTISRVLSGQADR